MGFYGKFNRTQTPLSIDKIVSNRYTLESQAQIDGIYLGRYVLIAYESEMQENNIPEVYMYGDTATTHLIAYKNNDNQTVYSGYNNEDALTINSQINDFNIITTGTLVKTSSGHSLQDFNEESLFAEITEINGTNLKYRLVPKQDYEVYIEENFNDNYFPIKLTSQSYEPLTYYLQSNNQPGFYELDTSKEFNPNLTYYDKGINCQLYLINNKLVTSGLYTPYPKTMVRIPKGYKYNENLYTELWQADIIKVSEKDEDGNNIFINKLIWIPLSQDQSTFLQNYHIDLKYYQNNRGYDSTVWMKTCVNGQDKYILVSELNNTMPIFDIQVDKPTLIPKPPKYDLDSANTYYKTHLQPQWGFRVRSAANDYVTPHLNNAGVLADGAAQVNTTTDSHYYPSDSSVSWTTTFDKDNTVYYYNPDKSEWETSPALIPAAIYFNKDGFNADKISYSKNLRNKEAPNYSKKVNANIVDEIAIKPTGQSGLSYGSADESNGFTNVEPDIQELSIMLPSIGDSVAAFWDIVYGDQEVNKGFNRNMDIEWVDAAKGNAQNGLRLFQPNESNTGFDLSYKSAETVAGSINTMHDLIGMIIVNADDAGLDINNQDDIDNKMNSNYLYYSAGKIYRRGERYEYLPVSYNYQSVGILTEDEFEPFVFYSWNGESYEPSNVYQPNQEYFIKTPIGQGDSSATIKLTQYKPNTIFYKTTLGDYILETNQLPSAGTQYYSTVTPIEPTDLLVDYKKNHFYSKQVKTNLGPQDENIFVTYKLDLNNTASQNEYFSINDDNVIQITKYITQEDYYYYDASNPARYLYIPPKGEQSINTPNFYYKQTNPVTQQDMYIKETRSIPDFITANKENPIQYYFLELQTTSGWETDENGNLIPNYKPNLSDIRKAYPIILIPYQPNTFYFKRKDLLFDKLDNLITDENNTDAATYTKTEAWYELTETMLREQYAIYNYNKQDYYLLPTITDFSYKNIYNQLINNDELTLEDKLTIITQKAMEEQLYYERDGKYHPLTFSNINASLVNKESIYIFTLNDLTNKMNSSISYNGQNPILIDNILPQLSQQALSSEGFFYSPSTYYYLSNGKDWILERRIKPDKQNTYYKFVNATYDSNIYYLPNKYWYFNNNELTLDTNNSMTLGRTYYTYEDLYVVSDSRNIIAPYSKFPIYSKCVPNTVSLGRRHSVNKMIPIVEFGNNRMTLNGSLLTVQELLGEKSKTNTNINTIYGCLNTLQEQVKKNQPMNYGTNTLYASDSFGALKPVSTDNWLNIVKQDSDDTLLLKHSRYNDSKECGNYKTDNILCLPNFIVDDAGHIVQSKNLEIDLAEKLGLKKLQQHFFGETNDRTVGARVIDHLETNGNITTGYLRDLMSEDIQDLIFKDADETISLTIPDIINTLSIVNEKLSQQDTVISALNDLLIVQQNKIIELEEKINNLE